jgi:preprotein translocase subunit SecF
MFIITYRNIFFAISAMFVALAIGSIAFFGLSLSTDFTGGTLVEMKYETSRPAEALVESALTENGLAGFSLRESGDLGFTLRAGALTDEQRAALPAIFSIGENNARVDVLSEVGPTIGAELRTKAWFALAAVLLCILLFIAFAFRKVSEPISSWVYGVIALVTLSFDVIVPLGFFAVLGSITGAQIDTLFVTAILTILGYSVHDTIVVFDRTRENLRINQEKGRKEDFAHVAGRSVQQTFARSLNTSITTLLSLVALYLLGPESTQDFALMLFVGIVAGTYSSIFFATPLLVAWEKMRRA